MTRVRNAMQPGPTLRELLLHQAPAAPDMAPVWLWRLAGALAPGTRHDSKILCLIILKTVRGGSHFAAQTTL